MRIHDRGLRSVVLILAGALLVGNASAQFSGARRGGGFRGGMDRESAPRAAPEQIQRDRLTQLIEEAHDRIEIQPGMQEQLWQNYLTKIDAFFADRQRPPVVAVVGENAVQQINRKADVIRNRAVAVDEMTDAVERLYRSFGSAQRSRADQFLPATFPAIY